MSDKQIIKEEEMTEGFYFEYNNEKMEFIPCSKNDIDELGEELLQKERWGAYASFKEGKISEEKERILKLMTITGYLHIESNIGTSNLTCSKTELQNYLLFTNELKIGVNIYGEHEEMSDPENRSVRYIQVGLQEDKGFTGLILDYQGGGVSDFDFYTNGEHITENELDEDDIFQNNVHAKAIWNAFEKYFTDYEKHPGFFKIQRSLLGEVFIKPCDSNIYSLSTGSNIGVFESCCGLSGFN